jgi:fructokinase
MRPHFRIAAIGELLWDMLPEGPQLGGAPANFAAISANLALEDADQIFLISRVGDDPLGRPALQELAAHGVLLDYISVDPERATGTVTVTLNADRVPTYRIEPEVAWDAIPETPQLSALAPTLDAICFGTLAQRSRVTRATLRRLISGTRPDCVRVFDVNLRAPYWTPEILLWGCACATILKMNEEEVPQLAHAVDAPKEQTPEAVAQFLLARFPIQLVAITRGSNGSLLVTREAVLEHPGIAAEVADTIGAGDAFTAGLTCSMLHRFPLPSIAEAANRLGAWVASQHGGMPRMDNSIRREWESAIKTASEN